MAGALSKKLNSLKNKIASPENFLTSNDDDASIDFNTSIDGSGTVDKSTYSADESEKPTPAPMLGELAKLRKQNTTLFKMVESLVKKSEDEKDEKKKEDTKKEKEAIKKEIARLNKLIRKAEGEFKIDNVSDGDSMGDNLDDYSREGNIENGPDDEFSPKEASSKKKR